jgi:hypothetical protein
VYTQPRVFTQEQNCLLADSRASCLCVCVLHTGPLTCLRSTDAWLNLEREIAGWDVRSDAREAPVRRARVTYARGGTYILSRAALHAAVRHRCVSRVASVRCRGWATSPSGVPTGECEHLTQHEDAAVGLCMHLLGALRMIDIKCLTMYPKSLKHEDGRSCNSPISVHPIKQGRLFAATYDMYGARAEPAGSRGPGMMVRE